MFQPLLLLNVLLRQREPGEQAVLPPSFRKHKREIRYRGSRIATAGLSAKSRIELHVSFGVVLKYPGHDTREATTGVQAPYPPELLCRRRRSAAIMKKVSLSVPFFWGADRPLLLPGRLATR